MITLFHHFLWLAMANRSVLSDHFEIGANNQIPAIVGKQVPQHNGSPFQTVCRPTPIRTARSKPDIDFYMLTISNMAINF